MTLAACYCMTGSPGLAAYIGNGVAFGQTIQFLIDVRDVEILFHAVADAFAEVCFHFTLNDKGYITEACTPSVEQREVDDDVTLIVHRGDLLGATETAAHAGSHNY